MESNALSESTQTFTSDLMQLQRRASRSHDSPRSTRNQTTDSGIHTNSWESNEMSPIMRKARSRSPSLGRYVLDRYKSPSDSLALRQSLLATFENIELEKILLKDENRDIRDEMIQLQSQFRQLETYRLRDGERFDLQQREVDALRLQLKIEKEGRHSNASLVEELQSDLSRKTELLALSNDELIEARDRVRVLEKQSHEEGDFRISTDRVIREFRERLDDVTTEYETEKKAAKAANESLRDEKHRVEDLKSENKDFQEAIRMATSAFGVPANAETNPQIILKNEESLQNLRLIVTRRNDLCRQLTGTERTLSARTREISDLSDQVGNITRVLRLEFKDETTPNSLLQDDTFLEQAGFLENSRVSPLLESLLAAVVGYVKLEARKRKVVREAVDATLKQFSWKGTLLNGTQIVGLLTSILTDWKTARSSNRKINERLSKIKVTLNSTTQSVMQCQTTARTMVATYKNNAILTARHLLDEAVYSFADKTKSRHETVRRALESNHKRTIRLSSERLNAHHEQLKHDAVEAERERIRHLEGKISNMQSTIKAKENDIDRLGDEIRAAESKLFRKSEEVQKLQFEHGTELTTANQRMLDQQQGLYQQIASLEAELSSKGQKFKQDLDQRAKQIAAMDETVVARDQKMANLQAKLKDLNAKNESLRKEVEMEKDPNRDAKLRAAIKAYERETADLRAKIAERDQLVTHLKRRVDEALNRGQKRLTETMERTRTELTSKETKLLDKEKEVEKLQDQLTRLSRVAGRGPNVNATDSPKDPIPPVQSTRGTVLTPQPMVKQTAPVKSVSGTGTERLPPITPAPGVAEAKPSSNGQVTRRFTGRSGSEKPLRQSRRSSVSSSRTITRS